MSKKFIRLFFIYFLLNITLFGHANDYEDAWKAVGQSNIKKARELFKKALENPETTVDAYLSLIYLDNYEGNNGNVQEYFAKAYEKAKNPYPYLYAMWFNQAALGNYGKKTKEKLAFIKDLLEDPNCNGSLKTAALYAKGFHHLKTGEFKDASKSFEQMQCIRQWQFVGPFDYYAKNHYDENFGPIKNPKTDATFLSTDLADIRWFTPSYVGKESWIGIRTFIKEYTAVVFAQSFVNSPQDQEVILNLGVRGNLKVWVNDKLIIKEQDEEKTTELDTYKAKCKLKKGYNRVLIQIAYDNNNFPNFMLRFTDNKYNAIEGITAVNEYKEYSKDNSTNEVEIISHFAEDYFQQKIKENPNNFLNYILLCDIYLRNSKIQEAKTWIDKALKKDPDNLLLRLALIRCYARDNNRIEILSEIEWIKQKTPNAYGALTLQLKELIREEKYDAAEKILQKQSDLYGEDAEIILYKIELAEKQTEVQELLSLIDKAYDKYPENTSFVELKYQIKKEIDKDARGALKILEKFSQKNYNYQVTQKLIREYFELNMVEKGFDIMENLYKTFPYVDDYIIPLYRFYFVTKDYKKALKYVDELLALAPYHASNWEEKGLVYEQQSNKKGAIDAYQKSLYYDPNLYQVHKKLRKLQGKKPINNYLPQYDIYELIKNTKTEGKEDYDWYYILDEAVKVIYPRNANEEFYTTAVKIMNEDGIDYWKEVNLPYYNRQRLVVEKAEVIKKNGTKLKAEQSNNKVVFTNLEVGDAILVKYKLENYYYGKFAQIWDKYIFDTFIPSETTRYVILASNEVPFKYEILNGDLKPIIEEKGKDFKRYTWEVSDRKPLKSEELMPPTVDIGTTLHLSTMNSWKDIASWYNSLSLPKAKMNLELTKLLDEIFQGKNKNLSDYEKAKTIYEYIVKNIRYSSIPFRQGAYVPQTSSNTYHTRLGDCKDVSTLFVTLAREMGLDANLVLISTKNNGLKSVLLPSLDFNHCISKVMIDDKPQYLELTNSYLPFGSLTPNLIGAPILEIPQDGKKTNIELDFLKAINKTKDIITRKQDITIEGRNLNFKAQVNRSGNATSYTRSTYNNLSKEKQVETLQQSIGQRFENPVTVKTFDLPDLNKLSDSLTYTYNFNVKNEVINLGSLKTFKIPFADIIVTADRFNQEERNFPIEYWDYEVFDKYDDEITITIPEGNTFTEIPENGELKYKDFIYKISFELINPQKLQIRRIFKAQRERFEKIDYKELQEFFRSIITHETKYVVFK